MKTHQLAPGTVLGRYELLLPIASGGMATVWVARSRGSRGFSKTVAIKTILPNLSDDPTFEQMFLDEAAIASKIQHPNVAQIIDLGEQDEVLYLAMEWVDGESLSTLSKFARKNNSDIPLRVGLRILAQASAGIHCAHELRDDDDRLLELVHRDISPQNILVSTSGVVKIVDFGVAKALGRSGETSAGQLKGKVPFMAPEQAKGGKVDRRTDVFALGIILYRLATGTHPFLDDNDIKTMRNIITRPVMPPRVKAPTIPVELERTILKALQKDPDKRHATAAELETELEFVISSAYAGVPVEEVATFVRATLGDRNQRRRAAIRDAALKMDESQAPAAGVPPESLSGVMLTKTQTPATRISLSDATPSSPGSQTGLGQFGGAQLSNQPRTSQASIDADAAAADAETPSPDEVTRALELRDASGADVPTDPSARAADRRAPLKSDPVIGSSPTLAALASPGPLLAQRPTRRGRTVLVAAAVGCALGAGALVITQLGGERNTSTPASTAAATPSLDARSTPTGQPPTGSAPAPTATLAATPTAVAEASTEPTAEPTSTGSRPIAAVRAPSTPAPKETEKPQAPPPTSTPAKTADVKPPTPKPSSTNLPTVQEPGF
jgi:serine/threonine protein kinase